MAEQFSSMKCNAVNVPYISDKIPEAVFHGQAVKTVAYLRVSTARKASPSRVVLTISYIVMNYLPTHRERPHFSRR